MDASTTPMMAFSVFLGFPLLLSGKQVLTAVALLLLLAFLTLTGISLVIEGPHRTCEEARILQGDPGRRGVTGKASSHPIFLPACRGKITYYEITLANDSTLSKWLEYSMSTNTRHRMPLMEKDEEFHLTVVAHGEVCKIPTSKADFTRHGQDHICVHEKNIICSLGWHAKHVSITFAEIVLQTDHTLEIKKQLDLICTMAEYLHLEASSLMLIPVGDSLNEYFQHLTLLAEDIRYINSTKSRYVGLCWPVGFGVFTMLSELVRVLSHSVESNNLSQLLGYDIVGWRVLKQGYEKRNLKWQNRKMATPKPTWRPMETHNFAVWTVAMPETHSVMKSEASSSLVNKVTFSVILPYMDIGTQPVMINMDLESLQGKSPASTIFQSLSSELSPSLMVSSTQFEDKVTFETPPISKHVLYEASPDTSTQDDFPTTQKYEPMDNSTVYDLALWLPSTKNHFSNPVHHTVEISPEDVSSTPSSPELFSGEISNQSGHSTFMYQTASGFKSGEVISIIKLSQLSMLTLAYLRASSSSSEVSFSSVAISLLSLHDSHQDQKLLNVYTSASETFRTLALIKQMEISERNKSSILTYIPSTFDAILTNGDFYPRLDSPTYICPPTQLCYHENDTTSLRHWTDVLDNSNLFSSTSLLTFSFLTKTISTPTLFPSFSLSVPVELTLLFGLSNILPMEKLPDRRQVSSDRMNAHESFAAFPLSYKSVTSENSLLVFTRTEMDTSLWKEATALIYLTTPRAVILNSGFLSQGEMSQRKSQILELFSYGASLIAHPLELADNSSFYFSINRCDSINNFVRTPVIDPDALQLGANDLSLDNSFGTRTDFQITRETVSKWKESAVVFNNHGMATKIGLRATAAYHIAQAQSNTPPQVMNAIKWITATVGHRFSFSIPPETFHDQEDGNSTQMTLGINITDGSPTGLESWLQFNTSDQSMYGYPLDADFQYSPQEFLLFAIDSGGLKTEDKFMVEIFRSTTIPCHIYTVRTTNSYHSFLKNRGRIDFFLRKMSRYLFVDSPGDMVLLHLQTGSTMFMWYNKLLCVWTEKCARDEIQDVLTKLGRPEEYINPDFAEAMLPEFKIKQIEKVIYGGICLFTIKPTNDSIAFNRTVTAFKGSSCLITNTLSALLIALCSTTLAFLIVVHYRKYYKKTFQTQCAPSSGYIGFKMDMQSSRKSPLLEDVPPSTQLPLSVPTVSQWHSFIPNQDLGILRLPLPPKYKLPPLYGRTDTDPV